MCNLNKKILKIQKKIIVFIFLSYLFCRQNSLRHSPSNIQRRKTLQSRKKISRANKPFFYSTERIFFSEFSGVLIFLHKTLFSFLCFPTFISKLLKEQFALRITIDDKYTEKCKLYSELGISPSIDKSGYLRWKISR